MRLASLVVPVMMMQSAPASAAALHVHAEAVRAAVFVTRHRWENLLHNQSTIALRSALRAQGTRVVTTVGFYL